MTESLSATLVVAEPETANVLFAVKLDPHSSGQGDTCG
jgi:hypothetical protein